MVALILAIIYASFISLGLPDSLLGAGWPTMMDELNLPISSAGIIQMIISFGTIISSLFAHSLTKKFSTGFVTGASIALTAIAIFGFSISNSMWMFCVFSIPYGIGAGAVDATLNHYVSKNFSAKHMNWLHSFWGIGISISPFIMGAALTSSIGWSGGYRIVSYLQIALAVLIFATLPLWKKTALEDSKPEDTKSEKYFDVFKIKGVTFVLVAFFSYCALESTIGLWGATYLSAHHGVAPEKAAVFASFFFIGITVGRIISGFISEKLGDKLLIKIGIGITFLGLLTLAFPTENYMISAVGLVIIGLGNAPIYPAIIHATPKNFGEKNAGKIIGLQMASAYTGTTLIPPIMGAIAQNFTIAFLPFFSMILCVILLIFNHLLNKSSSL